MVTLRTLQLLLNTRANHGRCGICGTRLCADDTITVVGSELTHAECFLVHLLESPRAGVVDSGTGDAAADLLREMLAQTFEDQQRRAVEPRGQNFRARKPTSAGPAQAGRRA